MSTLAERIESLSRITQEKIQQKKETPFVIRGKDIVVLYKGEIPKCPYGNNFFPVLIQGDISMPNDGVHGPNSTTSYYYNEFYFPNLKKPGFFSKKKPQRLQVYWVNYDLLESKYFLQFPAINPKSLENIPSLFGEGRVQLNVTSLDPIKFRKACHNMNIVTNEDTVLATYETFEKLFKRVIGHRLGALYVQKMLTNGKYTFVPSGNSRTADDKFSNEVAAKLMERLQGDGFINKNRSKPLVSFK